ncbi:helix-turn-helix domain-containing protein [Candidatus Saccharibacteria bacterium]|nr:helix-turn-helix domain-containing protein [Candidatus Saccharibacteria bacterium]
MVGETPKEGLLTEAQSDGIDCEARARQLQQVGHTSLGDTVQLSSGNSPTNLEMSPAEPKAVLIEKQPAMGSKPNVIEPQADLPVSNPEQADNSFLIIDDEGNTHSISIFDDGFSIDGLETETRRNREEHKVVALLEILVRNPGVWFTNNKIIDAGYYADKYLSHNSLLTYIGFARHRLRYLISQLQDGTLSTIFQERYTETGNKVLMYKLGATKAGEDHQQPNSKVEHRRRPSLQKLDEYIEIDATGQQLSVAVYNGAFEINGQKIYTKGKVKAGQAHQLLTILLKSKGEWLTRQDILNAGFCANIAKLEERRMRLANTFSFVQNFIGTELSPTSIIQRGRLPATGHKTWYGIGYKGQPPRMAVPAPPPPPAYKTKPAPPKVPDPEPEVHRFVEKHGVRLSKDTVFVNRTSFWLPTDQLEVVRAIFEAGRAMTPKQVTQAVFKRPEVSMVQVENIRVTLGVLRQRRVLTSSQAGSFRFASDTPAAQT